MPELVEHAAEYSAGVLVLLGCLQDPRLRPLVSAFRGGPVFPAMFIGAALGIAVSRATRDEPLAGDRHGDRRDVHRDAQAPMTSTLLAPLLLGADGVSVTPQVVVAVVAAFLVITMLPAPRAEAGGPEQVPASGMG